MQVAAGTPHPNPAIAPPPRHRFARHLAPRSACTLQNSSCSRSHASSHSRAQPTAAPVARCRAGGHHEFTSNQNSKHKHTNTQLCRPALAAASTSQRVCTRVLVLTAMLRPSLARRRQLQRRRLRRKVPGEQQKHTRAFIMGTMSVYYATAFVRHFQPRVRGGSVASTHGALQTPCPPAPCHPVATKPLRRPPAALHTRLLLLLPPQVGLRGRWKMGMLSA